MEFQKSQVVLLCKEMNCHSDISSITLHASACVSVAVDPNMFARQRFVYYHVRLFSPHRFVSPSVYVCQLKCLMQEASVHLIFHDSLITDTKSSQKPNKRMTHMQDVSFEERALILALCGRQRCLSKLEVSFYFPSKHYHALLLLSCQEATAQHFICSC